MLSGPGIPLCGFCRICRDDTALVIHLAEVELRLDQALGAGLGDPFDGRVRALRDAFAVKVGSAQRVLREHVPLVRRLSQQLSCIDLPPGHLLFLGCRDVAVGDGQ